MRSLTFLFVLMMSALYFSACNKDDKPDEIIIPTPVEKTLPTTETEFATLLAGASKDSADFKVWQGNKCYRSNWNNSTQAYDPEEDVTDEPSLGVKETQFKFVSDAYTSERLGYQVGTGKRKDPMGNTGLNWEIYKTDLKTLHINPQEKEQPAGGKTDWTIIKLTETQFEVKIPTKSGFSKYIDRWILTKVN